MLIKDSRGDIGRQIVGWVYLPTRAIAADPSERLDGAVATGSHGLIPHDSVYKSCVSIYWGTFWLSPNDVSMLKINSITTDFEYSASLRARTLTPNRRRNKMIRIPRRARQLCGNFLTNTRYVWGVRYGSSACAGVLPPNEGACFFYLCDKCKLLDLRLKRIFHEYLVRGR